MKKNLFRQQIFKLIVFALLISFTSAGSLHAESPEHENAQKFPADTPLWYGPYEKEIRPDLNTAFLDPGAVYWSAKITLPEGARLDLSGQFPYARYFSISSYDATTGVQTENLRDVDILPELGSSSNPYLPGALRNNASDRDFLITVLNELPPEDPTLRSPNTLYAKSGGQEQLTLMWRVYVPDKNRDITGGVGLPEPRVTLENGEVLNLNESYELLDPEPTSIETASLTPEQYYFLKGGGLYGPNAPDTLPSHNPPKWRKVFNIWDAIYCAYSPICPVEQEYFVGQHATVDNQYMTADISRLFGDILVIRGKAPITPATYMRNPFMEEHVDMRYWSLTTNESSLTTKMEDGMHDEQAPLDINGFYTIVISLPEDRPNNAYEKYGVKWISWPLRGNGAGTLTDGLLIFRHMLPAEDFEHALQNVMYAGDEAEVLGPYMPVGHYMSIEEFEALGNQPWEYLP